jgi:two-component system, OmpR family, sensor kinase
MTLRAKLILWYCGLLGVILILFGAALYGTTRWALLNTIDSSLIETANLVIQNSGVYTRSEFGAPDEVRMRLPELDLFRASGVFVQVWELGETPTLTGQSTNLGSHEHPLDADALATVPPATPDNPPSHIFTNTTINDGSYRVMTRPIHFWERQFVIQTATSLETANRASQELLFVIGVGMVVAMVGSVMMAMGFANRALTPIDRVTQAAARITATDDLKTRLDYEGPMDEIGRMNSVFNQMMTRLENVFGVQQRFVADVSHELRTPLTAIRGNLDLVKRYGADKESLDAIESEVERMSRLVSDLLLLARADYGGLTLDLEPVDLDTTISEIYREGRILAKDREVSVSIHDFEPVRIKGDADRLKQLFLNLISNAIKFTPAGGSVTMNLRRTYNDAIVEVTDTGVGMAAEDLPRIFDRFYQTDPARVRKGEGSGLGLSIAKWIAEAHGGRIEVASELGKGTTFTVTIPHIEEKPVMLPGEVTRPRITLIRRASGSGAKVK